MADDISVLINDVSDIAAAVNAIVIKSMKEIGKMAKIIIDIPDDEYNYFMSDESFDVDDGFDAIEYICNGIALPDKATNGDVIKALYPKTTVKESKDLIIVNENITTCFSKDWWNAPYKAEIEG